MVEPLDADVIVVGAGPVGMTAALALAARGLNTVIVERQTATSDAPKAISLDDESLRLFQSIGIGREVMKVIVPGTGTMYFGADGEPMFMARGVKPYRLGFPVKNPFAQPDLERVLFQALTHHERIDARFGTAMTGLHQHEDHVVVTMTGPSGEQSMTARYLVGADGGRSAVRRLSGIRMRGSSFDEAWLVIDTLGDTRRERYGMHHADPARPHVIVPGLGGRCRYEMLLTSEEAAGVGEHPPFELIRQLVGPYRDIRPDQVERAVAYTFHALSAERWRDRRVFLAGDAAHMMPPFAGQGLNSGIRDVANLTWKIAEAVQHTRGERFLDSYEQERRPHAEAVIRSSVRLGRVVMTTNSRLATFRDRVIREALTRPEGRAFFEEMRYRPVNRITAGLVLPDTTLAGTQIAQPLVFDFSGHQVEPLDHLLHNGWAVIAVGIDPVDVPNALTATHQVSPVVVAVPLDDLIDDYPLPVRVAIDVDNDLYREVEPARGHFLLIRPDRFVALSWRPGRDAAVAQQISLWIDAPEPSASLTHGNLNDRVRTAASAST